jgi:S1-C subfamily serine protease
MKKRILSLILCLMVIAAMATPALAAVSLSNFSPVREYDDAFSDVAPGAWYYDSVRGVYERGLMDGSSGGRFRPGGDISLAETIKLAACLHKGYYTGSTEFPSGSPWYEPYVAYCIENGIPAAAYGNYAAIATRADFAVIIGGALPDEALTPMNHVPDGSIPDTAESYSYGQAVYRLYRAGVFAGADSKGSFRPNRTISRAEAAAVIMRIVDANSRRRLTFAPVELTAEEIYKLASPAVFYIEILRDNEVIKTGSGFFINASGLAVTNHHVIEKGDAARIITDDGETHNVLGVYDYDAPMDIALIQIRGSGFPFLGLADSSALLTGATVYALGSPLGLYATFSKGIVSQARRVVDDTVYIQIDTPISSGSSGGVLLDTSAKAVGITAATYLSAQNINFAVPINFINTLSRSKYTPLSQIKW